MKSRIGVGCIVSLMLVNLISFPLDTGDVPSTAAFAASSKKHKDASSKKTLYPVSRKFYRPWRSSIDFLDQCVAFNQSSYGKKSFELELFFTDSLK